MRTPGKFLLLLLLTVFLSANAGDLRPARQIRHSDPEPVRKGGLAVVVFPGSSPVVRFAGKELSQLLSRRLGFPIPLLEEPQKSGRSVVLGINELSRRHGITEKIFCRDGFVIKSQGNLIFIAGLDDPLADPEKRMNGSKTEQYFERGTLFGAYDFLERFAGIRFYFAGRYGTVIPRGEMQLPRKIDLFDRPDFEIRRLNMETGYFSEKPGHTVQPRNHFSYPSQKHREKNLSGYRLKVQTLLLPNSHGLNHLSLAQRFGKLHPEYFALLADGRRDIALRDRKHSNHLCFSSGIKQEILQDARAYLRNQPAAVRGLKSWNPHGQCSRVFDVQPQDAFEFCRCIRCKDSMSSVEKASRTVWDFVLDIADQLQKEKTPGMLQMMAYYPYTQPPKRDLPPNLLVQVAVNGPWMHGLEPGQAQLVRSWNVKGNSKVMLWNYCGKWSHGKHHGIPHWTPRRIGAYYRDTGPYISGAYLLCDGDYYLFSALNMYVFAKTAWDLSCDTALLLREFYQQMFAPADKEMAQFFDRLEELWLKANSRLVETVTGPLIAPPSEYELFEVHFSPGELRRMTALFDRAEKKAAGTPEALERIRFMRWNFLDRICTAAQQYHKNSGGAKHFRMPGNYLTAPVPADWSRIPALNLQRKDGHPAAVPATLQAVLTEQELQIRIRCSGAELPQDTQLPLWKQEHAELFLNPSCDRKNYYQILLSAAGRLLVQQGVRIGGTKRLHPVSLSGIKHGVQQEGKMRTYQIRIPRASLPELKNTLVCNFNVLQKENGKDIAFTWSPFLQKDNHDLLRFGILDFDLKPSDNQIKDGDFTSPGSPRNPFGFWHAGKNTTTVRWDNGSFVTGSRSLQIRCSSPEKKITSVSTPVKLQPNRRYRLSYYVKLKNVQPTGKNGGVNVGIWSGRNRWIPRTRLTGSTDWIRQSMEFTADQQDRRTANVNLMMYQCTGTVNFDHVVLEEIQ